jgi:hypothetical protein
MPCILKAASRKKTYILLNDEYTVSGGRILDLTRIFSSGNRKLELFTNTQHTANKNTGI